MQNISINAPVELFGAVQVILERTFVLFGRTVGELVSTKFVVPGNAFCDSGSRPFFSQFTC